MHWQPKWADASAMRLGLRTAAVLRDTLSAPASRRALTSLTERTPPPTVRGMNTCSETCSTTSIMISRESELAVMSKKTSSSAPSRS